MSPDQERRLEEIFSAARKLPPPERAAFLERACGGESELRRQADSLLAAHDQAGQFLQPTVALSTPNVLVGKSGDRIGRYKLLEQIGEGGFGVVWMAEQEEPMRRRVALKIIKLGMDTREVVARFDAERQALAMMEHPNIARVFDGGATDTGRPYFVMELVKGIPITEYCDANKLATLERLALFIQVCQAVQHAHQKGIIHRDLKPSNILVTVQDDRPVPKVIDFGVAKATQARLTERTVFTRFSQWIGTPAYMSPEQAGLGSLDVDTRSDVYSLGVLLYELLTGRTPFDTQTLLEQGYEAVMQTIREEEPSKPSTRLSRLKAEELRGVATQRQADPAKLERAVSGDLDWIVMKCLEKDRKRRYETPDALAADVARHLSQEPVAAAAPDPFYLAGKFVRRHKAGLATAAALTLALVGGLVASLWQAGVARQAQRLEARLRGKAEFEELKARENLYAADVNLASQAADAGNSGRARSLLMAHKPLSGRPDMRGFEWRYLWAAARGDQFATLRGHSNVVTSLAVSPDGKTLLSGSYDVTVRVWDLASGTCLAALPRYSGGVFSVAFSPDGKLFAVGKGAGEPTLWRTDTHEQVSVLGSRGSRIALSPTGTLAVFGAGSSWFPGDGLFVKVIDYSTGEELAHFPNGGSHGVFSPDGKLLALSGKNDAVRLWDVGSRQELGVLPKAGSVMSLAFSPDGQNLAAAFYNGDIAVWDLTSQRLRTLRGHTRGVWQVAFSPDGKTLASVGADQTLRLWDVPTWTQRHVLHGQGSEIWSVTFSRDSRIVITGGKDETIRLYPAHLTRPVEAIAGVRSRPRISGDGTKLAALGDTGQVGIWNVPSRRLVAELGSGDMPAGFLPDGKGLVTVGTNGMLTCWDVAAGSVRSRSSLPTEDPVTWSVLSPDGGMLATGDRHERVRLWRTGSGELLTIINEHTAEEAGLAFSPDNQRFTTVFWSRTRVWDRSSFKLLAECRRHKMYVSSCAWSSDGRLLATGSVDGTAITWDAATYRDIALFAGDMQGVDRVAFSPDSRTLVTAGSDTLVKFWNLATQRDVLTITRMKGPFELLFTWDGSELLVGSWNGVFNVLPAPPLAQIDAEDEENPTSFVRAVARLRSGGRAQEEINQGAPATGRPGATRAP